MTAPLRILVAAILVGIVSMAGTAFMAETQTGSPLPQRVREIAAVLEASPRGFETPVAERNFWKGIAADPAFRNVGRPGVG